MSLLFLEMAAQENGGEDNVRGGWNSTPTPNPPLYGTETTAGPSSPMGIQFESNANGIILSMTLHQEIFFSQRKTGPLGSILC
jgi:hypothetical protein